MINKTNHQFAEGYVLPHIFKRALEYDSTGVHLLSVGYASILHNIAIPRSEINRIKEHAELMTNEGFHTTALVLSELARRADKVKSGKPLSK